MNPYKNCTDFFFEKMKFSKTKYRFVFIWESFSCDKFIFPNANWIDQKNINVTMKWLKLHLHIHLNFSSEFLHVHKMSLRISIPDGM